MNTSKIEFAVAIPEAALDNIDKYINLNKQECTIEKKPMANQTKDSKELGFDPITGSSIVWIVITFLGATALDIAVNMISDALYDYLKSKNEKEKHYEIPIRLSDGRIITLSTEDPLNKHELEEFLSSLS